MLPFTIQNYTPHTFNDFKCYSYHIYINIRQPSSQSSVSRKIPIFTLVRSLCHLVFAFFNIQKLNNNQHHNTDSINYNRRYKHIMNWTSHCQHFIIRRTVFLLSSTGHSYCLTCSTSEVHSSALLLQNVLTHWPISSSDDLVFPASVSGQFLESSHSLYM
jgi:hypothetical protein